MEQDDYLISIFRKAAFLHIRLSKQLFQRFTEIIPLTVSSVLYRAIYLDVSAEIPIIIRTTDQKLLYLNLEEAE